MDDLRRELQQAGFANTSLDLRQGTPQDQARQQFAFLANNGNRGGRGGDAEPEPAPAAPAPPRTSDTSRLDVEA
jgi:hypothetical protein